MKKLYPLLFILILNCGFCILNPAFSQTGQWVWLRGDSTFNNNGNFGTQGVTSPSNESRALYEACEWTDLNGNFWMFGGKDNSNVQYGDLWKYDPLTNQWTWIKGNNTANDAGVYGVQGVPSLTNRPPARAYAMQSWTDLNGDLWMYGGWNAGTFADLWRYNIATNQWTWMQGPNTKGAAAVYGTRGTPNVANNPGGRMETSVAWTDNAGDLWLFGGENTSPLNDMWRFHVATNTWTWMTGSNVPNAPGVYGTKGVEAVANTPGARTVYARWKDKNGYLWLFGGQDQTVTYANDLWRFNTANNRWTWMHGNNFSDTTGLYGIRCITAPANVPKGRYENRATWVDTVGNLWMFGGRNYFPLTLTSGWNDLWEYCMAKNQWTWESGDTIDNPKGNWGVKGVSNSTNKPNDRNGAVSWTDNQGHLYLFGGSTIPFNNFYNDLWKFTIDPTCSSCNQTCALAASFNSSDTIFCNESGQCIDFFDHSTCNPTSWHWYFQGAQPDTSSQQNPTSICYYIPGTYSVSLAVRNSSGYDSLAVQSLIVFASGAVAPTLSISHDTIFSSHASAYQWYFNGSPISGATDSFYVATQDGSYNVQITDSYGCVRLGDGIAFTSVNELSGGSGIKIYPNPTGNQFTIYGLRFTMAEIEIYNVLGEKVYSLQSEIKNPKSEISIDVSSLAKGVYTVRIGSEKIIWTGKLIKN